MPHGIASPRVHPAARRAAPAAALPAAPVPAAGVRLLVLALVGALLSLAAGRLAAQAHSSDVSRASTALRAAVPDPALSPDAVVEIVLEALAQNDSPTADRGIEVTFGFSSPANRAMVGPLDRFSDLVREEVYRPLLYHRHAVRAPAKVDGDRATERVVVTSATGERVAYTFSLSRQADGPYRGCWMTDGVMREPPSALRSPSYAVRAGGLPLRAG